MQMWETEVGMVRVCRRKAIKSCKGFAVTFAPCANLGKLAGVGRTFVTYH